MKIKRDFFLKKKIIVKIFFFYLIRIWQIPNANIFPQQFSSHFASLHNQHFAAFRKYLNNSKEFLKVQKSNKLCS